MLGALSSTSLPDAPPTVFFFFGVFLFELCFFCLEGISTLLDLLVGPTIFFF
jgi:hypothetical protein